MEVRSFVGMGIGHILVQFDAQARRRRRDDVAVLPDHGFLQDLGVEAAPRLNAFEDQEVGRTRTDLYVGGALDGATVEVRRDLRVIGLGHAGDFLGLQEAADAAQGHLQDGRRLRLQHPGEFVLGGQALAGGDGDRRLSRDARHLGRVLGRYRFLEPQGVIGFQLPGQADGTGRGELAVGAEQHVGPVADGFADLLHEFHRARDVVQRRLVPVVDRVGAGRVELHRGEALRHAFGGPFCGEIGIGVDVGGVALGGVEVRVRAQALVHPAPEELVDRLVHLLADDVPAGHLDAAQHPHQRDVGAQRVAAAVDVAPQGLDPERIVADHVAGAHVLDHLRHHVGAEGRRIDLAESLDAAVGGQLEEDEIASAEMGRRVAHYPGFDVGDLHGLLLRGDRQAASLIRWWASASQAGLTPTPQPGPSGMATLPSFASSAGANRPSCHG